MDHTLIMITYKHNKLTIVNQIANSQVKVSDLSKFLIYWFSLNIINDMSPFRSVWAQFHNKSSLHGYTRI